MNQNKITIISVFLVLLLFIIPLASAFTVQTTETYQDYLGNTFDFNLQNVNAYPFYLVVDNPTNYNISRLGTTVTLPKRNWIEYDFGTTSIHPIVTITSFAQIDQLVTKDSSVQWYLTFPWSASQVRSVTNKLIDMGVFKRTIDMSVIDANNVEYIVYPYVVGGDIRIYFNPQTFTGVVYPLTITENTITVNNATTTGWTTSNVTLINATKDLSSGNVSGGYIWDTYSDGIIASQYILVGGSTYILESNGIINMSTIGYTLRGVAVNLISFVDNFNASVDVETKMNGTSTESVGWLWMIQDINSFWGNRTELYVTRDNRVIVALSYNSKFNTTLTGTTYPFKDKRNLKMYTSNNVAQGFVNNTLVLTLTANNLTLLKQIPNLRTMLFSNGAIAEYDNWRVWQNNTGEIYIMNQSVSQVGNYINRTRLVVYDTGTDGKSIDMYTKKNGTSDWTLYQLNVTDNTWFDMPFTEGYRVDYKLLLNGNGSAFPVFNSLEYDEYISPVISFIDPTPLNNTVNHTRNIDINTSVSGGTGNLTAFVNWNNSLVGWWRMNEASGTLVEDFSGYGNNGTWTNNGGGQTKNITTGQFGNGIQLELGTGINIPNLPSINLTDNFTIEMWVKPSSNWINGGQHRLMSKFNWPYNGFYFQATNSRTVSFTGYNNYTSDGSVSSIYAMPTEEWTYWVVTYQNKTGGTNIYVNGNLDASGKAGPIAGSPDGYTIGVDFYSSTNYYTNATVDESKMWNRVLSNDEINASYNAGLYRLQFNITNLINSVYGYTAYVQDSLGNVNSTETRYLNVSTENYLQTVSQSVSISNNITVSKNVASISYNQNVSQTMLVSDEIIVSKIVASVPYWINTLQSLSINNNVNILKVTAPIPEFNNPRQTETSIYPITQSNNILVDVTVANGSINNVSMGITYNGIESIYVMTSSNNVTWSYLFTSGTPGVYSITHFYAMSNISGINSTTSTLYFTVLTISGSGSSGDTTPIPTPTPTPTPIPTPTITPISNITPIIPVITPITPIPVVIPGLGELPTIDSILQSFMQFSTDPQGSISVALSNIDTMLSKNEYIGDIYKRIGTNGIIAVMILIPCLFLILGNNKKRYRRE